MSWTKYTRVFYRTPGMTERQELPTPANLAVLAETLDKLQAGGNQHCLVIIVCGDHESSTLEDLRISYMWDCKYRTFEQNLDRLFVKCVECLDSIGDVVSLLVATFSEAPDSARERVYVALSRTCSKSKR